MRTEYALLTDLYQLTMMQGYYEAGKTKDEACFHMYFRECPFEGSYAVACGMSQLAEIVESFRFSDDDVRYLAELPAPGGGRLFSRSFLAYLSGLRLTCDIDAVLEGTPVFAHEPLVRVRGPLMECQLLETALLNCINFETLIATKASRVCWSAAGAPVAEFGLRRAQGSSGGVWASRAAVVGGCSSTSNVLAGKLFGLPVSGTHAHSWVMSFPREIDAFRAYAASFPNNCVLLVDTYDIRQGVAHAIAVGREMRERGERLAGIRIDSGDLAWAAKVARGMLDQAGFGDCGIVLSNDLDEYSIRAILDEGAQVASWGVGTKLATAFDQPALGGVYKLSALRPQGAGPWLDCLKVSESSAKLTTPGVLDIRRYRYDDGRLAGDMVFDAHAGLPLREVIVDPTDELRRKNLRGMQWDPLLHPFAREGTVVLKAPQRDAICARNRMREGLETLDASQKRILNPYPYPVGLEYGLWKRRKALAARMRE